MNNEINVSADFEVWVGGKLYATTDGPREIALKEALEYASQDSGYSLVQIFEVTRTLLPLINKGK